MESDFSEPLLDKPDDDTSGRGRGLLAEGSVTSSIILLTSAAVGTGVLALPWGISQVGVFAGLCLFAVAAAASYSANVIIFRCTIKTASNSYGELMTRILGRKGALVLDSMVWLEGIAAVATYLVFIGDYVPQICALLGPDAWCTDRSLVLVTASAVIWPLSCLRGLSALRHVSTFSVLAILFTCLVVVGKSPSRMAALDRPLSESSFGWLPGVNGFQVLSMCCFGFMNHTNTPEIARGLWSPSRRKVKRVVLLHTTALWAVYSAIAVCGYLSFLEDTQQDFLTNYDVDDRLAIICRACLSATLVLACPINIVPALRSLFNVLQGLRELRSGPIEATRDGVVDAGQSMSDSNQLYECDYIRVPITTACFGLAFGMAIKTPHVADLISSIGAFLSSPLMFAFPAAMYFRILGGSNYGVPVLLVLLTIALWAAEIFRLLAS